MTTIGDSDPEFLTLVDKLFEYVRHNDEESVHARP
jgi:hypothetical protein